MVYVQFQYLYRCRKILIEGEITNQTFKYIKLLISINKRILFQDFFQQISNFLHYENQQICQVLIISLAVIISQLIANFLCPLSALSSYSHLLTVVVTIYVLIFHIFMSRSCRLYMQFFPIIAFGTLTFVFYTRNFAYSIIFMILLGLSILILLLGVFKFFLQNELKTKIVSIFQLQSNVIYWFYLGIKINQFIVPYLEGQTISPISYLPTFCVFFITTCLKTWKLLDFNKAYLMHLLASSHQKQSKQNQNKQYIKEIFLKQQKNTRFQQKRRSSFLKSSAQKYDQQLQEINQSQNNEFKEGIQAQQQNQDPYTNLIAVVFILNMLIFALEISYIFLIGDQKIVFIILCCSLKLQFLILISQFVFITIGHQQKSAIIHLFQIGMDLIVITGPATLIVLQIFKYSALVSYFGSSFSIFLNCISPFITAKLFWQVARRCSDSKGNIQAFYYLVFWIYPISLRELPSSILENSQITIIIDVISLSYASIYLLFVSNLKSLVALWDEFQTIKKMKKFKIYLFQSLKKLDFNTQALSQSLFYVSISAFFGASLFMQSQKQLSDYQIRCYQIIYFFSHFIYLVFCRVQVKTQRLVIKKNTSLYVFDVFSAFFILISIAYTLFALLNSYDGLQNHKIYSLLVSILVVFCAFTNQFSFFSISNFVSYLKFGKLLSITLSYLCIFFPFQTCLTIGIYLNDFDVNFLFYYGVSGFFYIALIFTLVGVVIHNTLNLTQKSKRNLYIVHFMSQQLKKINMLEDPETILIISNLYDIMDGNADKLLKYLQTKQVTNIIIHDQKSIPYDYSFGSPQPNALMNDNIIKIFQGKIQNSDFNPLLKLKTRVQREEIKHKIEQVQKRQNFLIQEQILEQTGIITNQNTVQIKRMISKINKTVKQSTFSLSQLRSKIASSQDFILIQSDYKNCVTMMHRLFVYFSFPSNKISEQTFLLMLQLFQVSEPNFQLSHLAFLKFSDGQYMDQQCFKQFIIDFTQNSYQVQRKEDIESIIKTFIINKLLYLLSMSNQYFSYFIKRKNIQRTQQSEKLWNQLGNSRQFKQLQKYKQKQIKKINKNLINKVKKNKINLMGLGMEDHNVVLQEILQDHIDFNILYQANKVENQQGHKKHISFMSPDMVYSLFVSRLIQCMSSYEKIQIQGFQISSIRLTMSNLIAILTKLSDFVSLFLYPSVYVLYAYYQSNFQNKRYFLSFVNYDIIISVGVFGVFVYLLLLAYHRKDFQSGNLGLDQNKRTLSLGNLKYYTTFMLFLMGSSFASYFLMAFLNSFICDQSINKLFNFPTRDCYDEKYLVFVCVSLFSIMLYYPIALITFPYSSSIDRNLQIKYKSQYQILYLQCKFLVIGVDIVFNTLSFKSQELIKACTKTLICIILFIFFHKLKPCSYQAINLIQGKIYILLIIVNLTSILCYFLGFVISIILIGTFLGLFIVYMVVNSVWNLQGIFPDAHKQSDQLVHQVVNRQKHLKLKLKKTIEQQVIDQNVLQFRQQNSQVSILKRSELNSQKSQMNMPDSKMESQSTFIPAFRKKHNL